MAIITLLSGTGAPGVTTTAVALALNWHRQAILLEADPSGAAAIQSGYLRGETPRTRSVADLAIALRAGELTDSLPGVQIPLTDTLEFIPGARSHAQAVRSLPSLWQPLALTLADQATQGVDVIVDAGRLGMDGYPAPLVHASDLVLLVSRCTLPAVAGIRSWAPELRHEFAEVGVPDAVGLLLIGPGRRYSAREISKATNLPVVATLPLDPVAAEVYSLGAQPGSRHHRSPLVKALPGAVEAISAHLDRQAADIEEASNA